MKDRLVLELTTKPIQYKVLNPSFDDNKETKMQTNQFKTIYFLDDPSRRGDSNNLSSYFVLYFYLRLSADLFNAGIRLAINVGISVSREGSAA